MENNFFNLYKLIVAGGRNFSDYNLLSNKLSNLREKILENNIAEDILIVSGHAPGADTLGEKWAIENHVSYKVFPANWNKFKNSAGAIRNKQMGDYADGLLAFWDGKSTGTKNMITYAKEKNISILIVRYS
jgi:hypothetical protein